MTQEEKAKAYDEALEWMREIYPTMEGFVKEDAEHYFPELKESEDERIREWLIEMVEEFRKANPTNAEHNGNCSEAVAYLEKQKEQKPNLSDGEIEDKKRDIVAAIRNFYSTDYAKYLTSFLKGLSPEDNSEDEYGQEMLGIAYKLMYEHIPENLRTQEFWDSLKFMREYTGRVAIIHSYQQPEIDLEKFTEKIKTFQRRYKYPESISIKGAMAFMARMFYQYPNVARQWYDGLPKATMDDARKEE